MINPNPLLLLNHFTFPVFLPAAGAVSSAIAATGQKKNLQGKSLLAPPLSSLPSTKPQLNPFVTTTVLSLRVSRNHNSVWETGTTPCGRQASQKKGDRELKAGRRRGRKTGKPQIACSRTLRLCPGRSGRSSDGVRLRQRRQRARCTLRSDRTDFDAAHFRAWALLLSSATRPGPTPP